MRTKLRAIEHRAVSGAWLLGDDFEEIIISDETYSWLWRNIYTICDNPRLIKMFWANSSQYFDIRLQIVFPEYSNQEGKLIINNQEEIDKRDEERNKFIEFHYALGGLLLYRKQYETLNYIFEYSQSLPPKYVLLPETMTQIFIWFENFRNEYKHKTPIDLKYYFPELDNLGNRRQVNYWICGYITILFFRQYSLQQYYVYQNFTELPNLPTEILELNSWLDSVSYFEKCLNDIISNSELIKTLEFDKLDIIKKEEFSLFIIRLKEAIKYKIGQQKLDAELSEEKIKDFLEQSNEIISKAFEQYKLIFITKDEEHQSSELKLSVNGERTLMSKSAFTDNDITHLNYDVVFASSISTNKIKRLIPNAFLVAKTKRYLLNKDNFLIAFSKIISNNNDIVVIGVNISFDLKEIIETSIFNSNFIRIPSTEYHTQDTFFILRKNQLPAIEHKQLKEEEKTEFQLKLLNKELQLYGSVIDINKPENQEIKDKWNIASEPDNQDLKVQLTLSFISILYWKNEREIIQISIASEFREQGIQNDINDVEPLSIKNNKE